MLKIRYVVKNMEDILCVEEIFMTFLSYCTVKFKLLKKRKYDTDGNVDNKIF